MNKVVMIIASVFMLLISFIGILFFYKDILMSLFNNATFGTWYNNSGFVTYLFGGFLVIGLMTVIGYGIMKIPKILSKG